MTNVSKPDRLDSAAVWFVCPLCNRRVTAGGDGRTKAIWQHQQICRGARLIEGKGEFDHVWFWRARLPNRKGQRCRIRCRARSLNSVAVEFEDGEVVCTSKHAVRLYEAPRQLDMFGGA
jgi:hypothetical protein